MDNAFLGYACDVLADTGKGLTGSEIVKYCNRFALDYNVRIPVDDVKMLQINHKPQIPNKRTALKMNLETFELQQQIEIIRFLSELPKLKDNEDIKELINKMNVKFGLSDNQELKKGINETKHWLEKYQKSFKVYNEALDKYGKGVFQRNVLDDMRLSLELLLKDLLNNDASLENQWKILGKRLKDENVSKEISNVFEKILSYYGDYQNQYIKHNDNVKENEIELIISQTNTIMQFLIKTLS